MSFQDLELKPEYRSKLDNVIREVIVGGDTAGWTADFGNVIGLNHVYPQLEEFAAFWTLKEDKAVVIRW